MVTVKTFISVNKPAVPYGLWLKPVDGGFAAYMISGGNTKPLKLVEDNGTEDTEDDKVKSLVGSVKDEKGANTINGAKAYAKDLKNQLKGSPNDTSSDLTLYGLKALIKEKTTQKAKANGHKTREQKE